MRTVTLRQPITKIAEMRFLELSSRVVWIGLLILFLSGLGLFSTNPEKYLASSKFLAKITIVSIIFLNGLVFHFFHLPRIKRHVGEYFQFSDEFMRYRPTLLISGAISFISWTSALILGALPYVAYSYSTIMYVYLGLVTLAAIGSLIIFRRPV